MTAVTVVCCSMTSLSQTRYGSAVVPGSARQGSRRRWRSYQPSSAAAAGAMTADDTRSGMPAGQRHVYGPRALGALVPAVTRAAFRRRAPATAQVLTDWAAIVGPALADVTLPRRLQGGTLSISCAGPIAMELQHLTTELL